MNETIETILSRRSIRKFTQQPVPPEDLQEILQAGINAPNAQNKQLWHFTVISNHQVISELIDSVRSWLKNSEDPASREKAENVEYELFYNAPVNIIVSADEKDRMSQPNCAAAVQNMLLAAHSLGLGSCWKNMIIGLLNSEYGQGWNEKLGIPDGYRPFYGMVLGYKSIENIPHKQRRKDCINYIL